MMKRGLLCITILLCWHSWSYAEMPIRFFAEALLHLASIDGTVQRSDVDVLGSEIDLDGTLGLENVNGLAGKAGILIYGRHELVADYRRYHLSEDSTLSSSIRFGDIDFSANLPISPSLTFQTLGFFYGFRLIDTDLGFLSLRPGVEIVDYEVGVKASLLGFEYASSTYSESYTVPFIMIAGEGKLHPLVSLTGEFSGGRLDDQTGYLAQALLKFTPHPNISALLGYSQVWFEDETEDNPFEVTLSGLMAGIQVVW
jgi:hypothetical protein